MTSFGQRLRQERLSRGIDVATIAADTRICGRYLEAIESDDYSCLPGGFFRRAFARQYANALGVSDAEVDAYLQQIEPETPVYLPDLPPAPPAPSGWARRSNLVTGVAVGVLMLAAGGYAWLQSAKPRTVRPPISVERPKPPDPEPPALPTVAPRAAIQPQEVVVVPANSSPVETAAAADGGILRLAATEATWVSVSSHGKVLFTGLLRRDETRAIDGIERARVLVGNAGGIEVQWRGEPVGPIGPRGQTRIVWLRPDGVEIESPRKPES